MCIIWGQGQSERWAVPCWKPASLSEASPFSFHQTQPDTQAGCSPVRSLLPFFAMPGPEALLALLISPVVLLALALVLSGPWRLLDSQPPLDLMRELEQRQQDLSRLLASVQARASRSIARRAEVAEPLGCAQLNGLSDVGVVGAGITKLVLRTVLSPSGEEIALKSVHWTGSDVTRCVQRYGHAEGCFQLAAYKLLKETVLLQTLDHEGIIKLHGQCYNNSLYPEMKVVSMLELGTPLEMIQLLQIPWEERFKICLDLVELLYYLANSPLGSIALLDFQPRQFVMVNGLLKVTDLDDVSTEELSCKRDQDCILKFPTKTFFLKCVSHRNCKGINEKRNLFNAYRLLQLLYSAVLDCNPQNSVYEDQCVWNSGYFFTYLLPHTAPIALQPILKDILNATGDLRYGTNETLRAFQKVLHLYKSGLYLQKKPSHLKEYFVVKGFHSTDTEDYKCWPSYSPLRCMLSVHNVEEAASICSYHPQCQYFIITPQRSWTDLSTALEIPKIKRCRGYLHILYFSSTLGKVIIQNIQGRPLAIFQSNLTYLIPGSTMKVYVKRSASSRGSL